MDPQIGEYLNKYFELEENKKSFNEMMEKVYLIANVEEFLNKTNSNSTNGVQRILQRMEKRKKYLEFWLKKANKNKTAVKNEIEGIKHTISALVSIIQQERNFDCICNVYKDVTGSEFISESKVFLETDNPSEPQIQYTVTHLEDSVDSLYEETHNKEETIRLIDYFSHFIEEKIKICTINQNEVHKYGVNKKFIESEEDQNVSPKSESLSVTKESKDSSNTSKIDTQNDGKQSGLINKFIQLFQKKEDNKKP